MSGSRRQQLIQYPGGGLGLLPARSSYPCGFCKREFRSAQALGGHMNVHRRDRASLTQQQAQAAALASASASPTTKPPLPLLPNLNYPPPHDQLPAGSSSSSSPALNLELGRPPAEEDDAGLDLELRLAFC